ncbi:hypothetical protein QTI51_04080 [Variovorax sp. J22G73]|uniref:phage tail tube protein n=1 Tax=unclassified Variovorax TaxID=663243 RepID=UPI0025757225|nr:MULTISPECIES: hypothetical protein [unclassified Variovorax]MDM0003893.1 hypothetical protein [Variovorax sp. J22R203]MDM0096441.1 hypothetical protein [Variovorax sp. J22G73]
MGMVYAKNEYAIPRGRVFFDPFDANGNPTGEIAMGNCPGLNLSIETTKAEHFSSEKGLREKDESLIVEVNRTGSVNCDNFSAANFALWLSGTRATVNQAATAVVGEVRSVVPGRFYQLGAKAANPLGVRNVTAVAVKNADTSTPYTAGTDYNVDPETGRVQIIVGGAIVAGNVKFDYTPVAGTYETVRSGATAETQGALRIVADNASGANRDFYMPKVTLTPTGDLPIIADGTDFVQMQFGLEVLKAANAEAIYADGRPVPGV